MTTARAAEPWPVAVVLLNYRGWRDTLACVASLMRLDRGPQQIIVCDNASPDDSLDRLDAGLRQVLQASGDAWTRWGGEAQRWRLERLSRTQVTDGRHSDAALVLLDNGANLGFAAGNNPGLALALRQTSSQWFWLLNNDTEVEGRCLSASMEAARERPEVDLWGATVVDHDDMDRIQALAGGGLDLRTARTWHLHAFEHLGGRAPTAVASVEEVEARLGYVLGASMLASRRWLERVGPLDERYFLYCEEIDWAQRGRRAGLRIGWAPQALVAHKEGASIGTDPSGGSLLSVHHLMRSRIIFSRLHLGWPRLGSVLAAGLWQATKYALKRRPATARSCLAGMIAGLRAPLDGQPGASHTAAARAAR
jgi:GT2 family glycosyltransferase